MSQRRLMYQRESSTWFKGITILVSLCFVFASLSCKSYSVERQVFAPNIAKYQVLDADAVVKAHLKNGGLWIFTVPTFNDSLNAIYGFASKYDVLRNLSSISNGTQDTLRYSEVALFESNKVVTSSSAVAMSIIAGVVIGVGILCIGIQLSTQTKVCFGSCPTYYAFDGTDWKLQGEGFSSAILPSLEERDIDAFTTVKPREQDFVLRVKNEALETHVIRSCNLLAVPHLANQRVFHTTSDSFVVCTNVRGPLYCKADEGDVTSLLRAFDDDERFSTSDSTDITRKEVVECEYTNDEAARKAIVVGFRQTLMTTYLFYQTLSYMGNNAGRILSHIEAGKHPEQITAKLFDALGGIDVEVFDGTSWVNAGRFFEIGPIAQNLQALEIPRVHTATIKIRLRMTKGYWRINSAQLADVQSTKEAQRIVPSTVMRHGLPDTTALHSLLDERRTLSTVAGDSYDLGYKLGPNFASCDYFIESKGYYLEWIRGDWLGHESPTKIAQLMISPLDYIRAETVPFKQVESSLESSFWNSRHETTP